MRIETKFRFLALAAVLLLSVPVILCGSASAQRSRPALLAAPASMTAERVVYNLGQMDHRRAKALHAYQGTRIYQVKYHGFLSSLSARMIVKAKYLPTGKKKFTIQSSSGSQLLMDNVLKRLLKTEKEGTSQKRKQDSALSNANYRFVLLGETAEPSGPAYVLKVTPRRKDEFLYRGRIWVDAEDFALIKLQGALAKNPSFWVTKTNVLEVYRKSGDFWIPAYNRSVASIRLGGHAKLTIQYKDLKITDASQVKALSTGSNASTTETATAR